MNTHSVISMGVTPLSEKGSQEEKKKDTQYTVVSHMRYSVMWCLRYGGILCCCVCVCCCIVCCLLGVY